MSIFTVDYNTFVQQEIAPMLREPNEIAWLESLAAPLSENNVLFNDYISGSTYPKYSNSSAYTSGDTVVYINRGVYENITGSTGVLPTDTNTWFLVNDNYIGATERSRYNAQKYLYEFYLNRWFQLTGITYQSAYGAAYNNIYIHTNTATTQQFLMGETGPYSDVMSQSSFFSYAFMGATYIMPTLNDYTIWVPFYMSGTATMIEVRAAADFVNLAGMIYDIQYY